MIPTYKKICLVQLGRIGDLILMTPMFKALKDAFPKCELHIFAGRNNHSFLLSYPLIDRVHVYDKKLISSVKLIRELRQQEFDVWLDPKDHFSKEGVLFARLSGAKLKIGFQKNNRSPFDIGIAANVEQIDVHALERNNRTLAHFQIDSIMQRPLLFTGAESDARVEAFYRDKNINDFVLINLSASTKERYWPPENWQKLIQEFSRKIVVIADPKDRELAQIVASKSERSFYFPTKSILEVFSIVKRAKLVLTPDTSVVHIAAGFDRPVLGLYANYAPNYKKFPPLSSIAKMVIPPKAGQHVYDISFEQVKTAAEEVLTNIEKQAVV